MRRAKQEEARKCLNLAVRMGRCISYQLTPFDVLKEADRTLWQVGETDLQLVPRLQRRAMLSRWGFQKITRLA